MVPRVLMVQRDLYFDGPYFDGPYFGGPYFDGPDLEDVEAAIAGDGESALARLRRERFDAVLLDLRLEPLDGWCVLAAVGSWPERPRLIAVVADPGDVERALALGSDFCVAAGTQLHARALMRSTTEMAEEIAKETECPRPRTTSYPGLTTSGVSA